MPFEAHQTVTSSRSNEIDCVLTRAGAVDPVSDSLHVPRLDVDSEDIEPVEENNTRGALWMVVAGEDWDEGGVLSTLLLGELRHGGEPGHEGAGMDDI
jgi:hypothetical protein